MFLVIAKWAEYVRTTVVKKNIAWNDIPGYGNILRVILSEMKERELTHYPDSLIEAAAQLSANESIIPVFIEIVYKKTNIHIPKMVEICMDVTVKLLNTLNKKGSVFPSNFDFSFFYKGLDFLIDYQHSISTPKCLWMIYKTFHVFPMHEQYKITKKLLCEKVISCFYSWSWNIRDVFVKVFFYQLCRAYSSKGEELLKEEEKEFDVKKTLPKIKGIELEKQFSEVESKSFTARNSFVEEPSLTKDFSEPNNNDIHPGMFDTEEMNKGSGTIGRGSTMKSFTTKKQQYEKMKKKIIKIVQVFEDDVEFLIKASRSGKDLVNYDNEEKSNEESENSENDSDESLGERSEKEILTMILKKIPYNQRHYIVSALKEFHNCKKEYIKWYKEDKNHYNLPEIILQVPLDETESPIQAAGLDF